MERVRLLRRHQLTDDLRGGNCSVERQGFFVKLRRVERGNNAGHPVWYRGCPVYKDAFGKLVAVDYGI